MQYDYVDHQQQYDSGYMDNRYYMDEMEPTHSETQYGGSYVEMDSGYYSEPTRYYNKPTSYNNDGDYRQVGEGSYGSHTEMGGWHYEPRHRGYDSRGEVHHHHHHHQD